MEKEVKYFKCKYCGGQAKSTIARYKAGWRVWFSCKTCAAKDRKERRAREA